MTNVPQYAPARPGHPSGFSGGPAEIPTRRAKGGIVLDVLVFVIPCLLFLEVTVVGRLFASEIMLLALLPFVLIARGRVLWAPLPRTILVLGMAWLLNQVVTDIIRDTPFHDYARGWAKIGFTLVNFAVLYMLLHDSARRLVIFAVGLAVGGILDYYISPETLAVSDPWKFALGGSFTLLLIVGAQRLFERGMRLVVPAVPAAAAALNLVMGYRSLAGICFLVAVYLFLQWRGPKLRFRITPARLAMLGVLGFIATIAFIEAYGYAASTGVLGGEAQRKYERQASSQYGLLLGGRMEILVSSRAIMDSPIIGHGSWAKDAEYARLLLEIKGYGPWVAASGLQSKLIPTHSYLFGAWVEAGILGAVFWIYILWRVVLVLAGQHQARGSLMPLVTFCCLTLLWNVLFSPFGATTRIFAPYYVVVVLFAWELMQTLRRTAHPATGYA